MLHWNTPEMLLSLATLCEVVLFLSWWFGRANPRLEIVLEACG